VQRRRLCQAARAVAELSAPRRAGRALRRAPRLRVARGAQPAHLDQLDRARPRSAVSRDRVRAAHRVRAGSIAPARAVRRDHQRGVLMRLHRTPEPTKRDTSMRLKLMATLLLGAALACDSLLNVQSPSRVPASVLDDPANAELAVNGAQADFECALASYVALGGMMAGELEDATLSAGRWDYDRRTVTSGDAYTAGDASTLNLARVGRARVRLALGDSVGALADAQLVPAAFEYDATYSSITARRENLVYQQLNKFPFNTIAVPYRNFMYVFTDTVVPGKVGSVPDPRVTVRFDSATTMFDNRYGQWVQLKYAN